jgi:capsular polysaccharide biosynthesis protein
MMQCLPAIDWSVRNAGPGNCVLAVPSLDGWQEETLRLLGFDALPRIHIELHRQYHFGRVHYCEYLNGDAAFSLSPRCREVLDKMSARVDQPSGGPGLLYIARSDTGNRVVRNEADVQKFMEGYGFVSIVPGHYGIAEQIRLFRGARFIVGAHGAGLTNISFCEPRTKFLELVQSNYPNACMARIAMERDLVYHAEFFESDVNADVHQQEWSVNIKQLQVRLDAMMSAAEY